MNSKSSVDVACFLRGRAKDLPAPVYKTSRLTESYAFLEPKNSWCIASFCSYILINYLKNAWKSTAENLLPRNQQLLSATNSSACGVNLDSMMLDKMCA